jgi:hypothetical protein
VVIGYDHTNNVGHIGSINPAVAWTNLTLNANGGNVGIGVTNPVAKLHIAGDDRTNSLYITGSQPGTYYTNGSKKWNTFYASNYNGFGIYEETSGLEGYRLFIKEGGNVGIGTLNPDSKLTVAGDIQSRKVKVTINAGADFVFAEDYELKKLEDLQKYIQQHKHLPEIPSAKEMETKGIELGEMNIKLLQKIEELTLYILDQNKKIEALNAKVNGLEKKAINK